VVQSIKSRNNRIKPIGKIHIDERKIYCGNKSRIIGSENNIAGENTIGATHGYRANI